MNIAIITGSAGLVGSECVRFFSDKLDLIVGIDNDQRAYFFGASTKENSELLKKEIPNYLQYDFDIRDIEKIREPFVLFGSHIKLIIHAAGQPSHDWAAKEPRTDFGVNANGTLNLLELTREYCPEAVFIFTSSNKAYGDTPNGLPYVENEKRYECSNPIDESMVIDDSTHSLMGVSKLAADLLCQEYGKYFGLNTGIFRAGCITGPAHCGATQHGFLSYLVRCAVLKQSYTIYGYKGKQVRDNIHSYDLATAFFEFYKNPKKGEVYNIGGGVHSNCSVLEAIEIIEQFTGKMDYTVSDVERKGDHRWYVSDVSKFRRDYPEWHYKYSLADMIQQIYEHYLAI